MIEIPHGWTYVICLKLPTILRQHFVEWSDGSGHRQVRKQTSMRVGWTPQIVLHVHHEGHTDTIFGIDLVKAKEMGLKFCQTSVMTLVTSETLQQNVLPEPSGTIK